MDEKEYTDDELNAILAGIDFRLQFSDSGSPEIFNVTTMRGTGHNILSIALREWLNRWTEWSSDNE